MGGIQERALLPDTESVKPKQLPDTTINKIQFQLWSIVEHMHTRHDCNDFIVLSRLRINGTLQKTMAIETVEEYIEVCTSELSGKVVVSCFALPPTYDYNDTSIREIRYQ